MGGGRHHRLRSATPKYELDAFEFFSIILGTSSKRQVYRRRDLPFTHLIMITLLFATSLLVPNCRGCLTLIWTCWWVKIRQIMWRCDRPAAGFAGCGMWSWWSRRATCTMCRMRYADDDDAGTFCLFLFLYIWLCLTSIVNGHCCILDR